jgi:hypothetical protein
MPSDYKTDIEGPLKSFEKDVDELNALLAESAPRASIKTMLLKLQSIERRLSDHEQKLDELRIHFRYILRTNKGE